MTPVAFPVRRAWLLVVALLATAPTLLSLPGPAAAALPPGFFGMTAQELVEAGEPYRSGQLAAQRAAGAGMARAGFHWYVIERPPGNYDFSYYDGYVSAAARAGMQVLPVLEKPPPFRSRAPVGHPKYTQYPPSSLAEFGDFAAALVRRYGPQGTLWEERRDVPKIPVRAWQIWNEPNTDAFWLNGPDPREYAALLRAASAAIRGEDPHAEVVTAGISPSRRGIPLDDFIRQMYGAGAAPAFDTLAIHAYAADDAGSVALAERARQLMEDAGDRSPMRITELGWPSDGPPSRFTFGEQGQVLRLRCALTRLADRAERLRLHGVVHYSWRDSPPPPGGRDYWGRHTGLIRADGRPKPSLLGFREAALGLQRGESRARTPTACVTLLPGSSRTDTALERHQTASRAGRRPADRGRPIMGGDLRAPIGALPLAAWPPPRIEAGGRRGV